MNDFTKEELEEIKGGLEYSDVSINDALLNKIQSMIDNYCEHEWDNMYCYCAIENIYCTKCNKRISGKITSENKL